MEKPTKRNADADENMSATICDPDAVPCTEDGDDGDGRASTDAADGTKKSRRRC